MSEAAPAPRPKVKGCLVWAAVIAGIGAAIGITMWRKSEQETQRYLAYYREQREKVHYLAKIFPARVTFQRGPARDHDIYGSIPWRDVPAEWATAPDDSEGMDFAEFYKTEDPAIFMFRPFADDTHPQVSRQLRSSFEAEAASLFAKAIVLRETAHGKWKLRATLIPTPFGSNVTPENLPGPVLAQLGNIAVPAAPKQAEAHVDPRHAGTGGVRRVYSGKSPEQIRHEAEARAEREYRNARERHDRRHHHFYLVEAARDLGTGRVVILRRFGQVYGPTTVTRAIEIIQRMADSVELSTP
jgi:hypothetical protein